MPIEPGDLILTPGCSWHGHVYPGGDEPVVWLDGLDVPFAMGLRAGFMRHDPDQDNPLPFRDTTGTTAETAAVLVPAGTRSGQHSPVRRYPWDEAYPALRRLMARSPGATLLPAWSTVTRSLAGPPWPPWAAYSMACPPTPGPGRAGKPQARSSRWPAAPGRWPAAARPSRSCRTTWRPSRPGP